MQPYITYREEENGKLQYFILQRAYPHYVGVIAEGPKNVVAQAVPVSSHNLWVCYWGVIQGRLAPSYKDAIREIQVVLEEMALWFYEQRVLKEPSKYKKFKINVSSTN